MKVETSVEKSFLLLVGSARCHRIQNASKKSLQNRQLRLVPPRTKIERTDAWERECSHPSKRRRMPDKKVLGFPVHPHTCSISWEEDVCATCTQNSIAIRMHLEQVLPAVKARNLLLIANLIIISVS